jgi:hypothetical protein
MAVDVHGDIVARESCPACHSTASDVLVSKPFDSPALKSFCETH